jgi:hypothetical protein
MVGYFQVSSKERGRKKSEGGNRKAKVGRKKVEAERKFFLTISTSDFAFLLTFTGHSCFHE